MKEYDIITIIGPTASGKTSLAVRIAAAIDAEIISADSRQVYRRMDIGTGKDLDDYVLNGKQIPYHLIDIAEPGEKYNLYRYQHDFLKAYNDIRARGKRVVVCGGSGLYVESILRGYVLPEVPQNKALRSELEGKPLSELKERLAALRPLHNDTDTDSVRRAIRAIEIALYEKEHGADREYFPKLHSLTLGIDIDRDLRRQRISKRLRDRLDEGMIEEVAALLQTVRKEDLTYYGLEYRYVTEYVCGDLTYDEMYKRLEIAIHQFAKRQMTWFRGMERRGVTIHWVQLPEDGLDDAFVARIINLKK